MPDLSDRAQHVLAEMREYMADADEALRLLEFSETLHGQFDIQPGETLKDMLRREYLKANPPPPRPPSGLGYQGLMGSGE